MRIKETFRTATQLTLKLIFERIKNNLKKKYSSLNNFLLLRKTAKLVTTYKPYSSKRNYIYYVVSIYSIYVIRECPYILFSRLSKKKQVNLLKEKKNMRGYNFYSFQQISQKLKKVCRIPYFF